MDKIIKSSKVIYKALGVIFWVMVVCCAVGAAACLLAVLFGDRAAGGSLSVNIGSYELTLAESCDFSQMNALYLVTLADVAVLGAAAGYIIKVLRSVFRPMSEGQPFVGSVSVALRKLAFAVLFTGIAGSVLAVVTDTVLYHSFDIASLFSAEKVAECRMVMDIDATFLVWFVIFLLLGNVFSYGEQLQRESDETL